MISSNRSNYKLLLNGYLSNLNTDFDSIGLKYPFDKYCQLLAQKTRYSSYRHMDSKLVNYCHSLVSDYSEEALELYHRCLLLYLIVHISLDHDFLCYPDRIEDCFYLEYTRIVNELTTNPSGFYSYKNDLFCKDLAVCTHEMFPMGAFKTEVSGIPRRIFFTEGIKQFVRLLKLFTKLGKNKPIYEWHFDVRYRADFTPQGWDDCFRLLAEMLERNPEIIGLTGASWFFDPQIEQISPHLSYLRKRIEDNGGEFFLFCSNDHTTELALSSSNTRRKLYEQGLYKPSSYLVFWPREKLLEWARKN